MILAGLCCIAANDPIQGQRVMHPQHYSAASTAMMPKEDHMLVVERAFSILSGAALV